MRKHEKVSHLAKSLRVSHFSPSTMFIEPLFCDRHLAWLEIQQKDELQKIIQDSLAIQQGGELPEHMETDGQFILSEGQLIPECFLQSWCIYDLFIMCCSYSYYVNNHIILMKLRF